DALRVTRQTLQPGKKLLKCYSCKLDFKKSAYNRTNGCIGQPKNFTGQTPHLVDPDYLVTCGVKDYYCKVERVEVMNVLVSLSRECTDVCHYGCRPKGFGIHTETCTQCCNTTGCNNGYPKSQAATTACKTEFFIHAALIFVATLLPSVM
ncbi:unnamed protein product, partial [Meganyctiphanes norvegica]